jgi:hypothetical protein
MELMTNSVNNNMKTTTTTTTTISPFSEGWSCHAKGRNAPNFPSLRWVLKALASPNSGRQELRHLRVSVQGATVSLVGTDGRRLHIFEMTKDHARGFFGFDVVESVSLIVTKNTASVISLSETNWAGVYPNWRVIVDGNRPKTYPAVAHAREDYGVVNLAQVLAALYQANHQATRKDNTPDMEDWTLNEVFASDLLGKKTLYRKGTESVDWEIASERPLSPIVLRYVTESFGTLHGILMPVRGRNAS